jgi:hypothetical protein
MKCGAVCEVSLSLITVAGSLLAALCFAASKALPFLLS